MDYSWAKTYPLMGHGGPIRIRKSIRFICIYFFPDTQRICIQDVSDEYRYRIRIQVFDTLWIEVSVFHRLYKQRQSAICVIMYFRVVLGLFYPYLVGAALSGAPSRWLGSRPRSLSVSSSKSAVIYHQSNPLSIVPVTSSLLLQNVYWLSFNFKKFMLRPN
jgi:hypothetical protein